MILNVSEMQRIVSEFGKGSMIGQCSQERHPENEFKLCSLAREHSSLEGNNKTREAQKKIRHIFMMVVC